MDGQAKTAATKISGIETPDDQTITFRLTNPAGDFLNRLAMPATGAVPEEVAKCHTKAGDYGRYVIASGPYMIQGSDQLDVSSCDAQKPISGFNPSKKLYLVRNPNYDQATDTTRSNFIDGIKIDVDTNLDDIFNKVDRSELDGSLVDQPSKSILRRYQADPRKRHLIHVNAGDRTWYITMNTAVPPFDDVHLRKATNYVIDKQGMLQAWGGQIAGDIATHIMPPTLLNGRLDSNYDPYATPGHRGDESKARAEMRQSRYDKNKDGGCDDAVCSNLVMVNTNVTPWTDAEPIAVQSLARIGLKMKPRALAMGAAYTTIQTVANKIRLALHPGWAKDYADPYTLLVPCSPARARALA
jgi:peptide/nickel transport system substrate-binding protein